MPIDHNLFSTIFCLFIFSVTLVDPFSLEEATIADIQLAFSRNELTSRQLTELYISQLDALNPLLRCVLELNPDALDQADEADRRRLAGDHLGELDGVPLLLKDSIVAGDKMNTSLGSYALLGARAVVERLRKAGAVILGKASLSEWYSLRSPEIPRGWCARSGQGVVLSNHLLPSCSSLYRILLTVCRWGFHFSIDTLTVCRQNNAVNLDRGRLWIIKIHERLKIFLWRIASG